MTALVFGVLALVFFGMRVVSKIIGFVPYGVDDSLILAAFVRHYYHIQRFALTSDSHLWLLQSWEPSFVRALTTFWHYYTDRWVVTSKGLGLDIWHVRDKNITAHYKVSI